MTQRQTPRREHFGTLMRTAREALSNPKERRQAWIAKELGIDPAVISRWENSHPNAEPPKSRALVNQIAERLRCDPGELWEAAVWAWLEHTAPDVHAELFGQLIANSHASVLADPLTDDERALLKAIRFNRDSHPNLARALLRFVKAGFHGKGQIGTRSTGAEPGARIANVLLNSLAPQYLLEAMTAVVNAVEIGWWRKGWRRDGEPPEPGQE